MSWIDNLLTSSAIVWIIILFGIVSLYLKKTGKTFLDMIHDIQEFLSGLMEDKDDGSGIKPGG